MPRKHDQQRQIRQSYNWASDAKQSLKLRVQIYIIVFFQAVKWYCDVLCNPKLLNLLWLCLWTERHSKIQGYNLTTDFLKDFWQNSLRKWWEGFQAALYTVTRTRVSRLLSKATLHEEVSNPRRRQFRIRLQKEETREVVEGYFLLLKTFLMRNKQGSWETVSRSYSPRSLSPGLVSN